MRQTSAGMARTPYVLTVRPRVCDCRLPLRELATARDADRLIAVAKGYMNVIGAFYGDQQLILHFDVVDVRDGRVIWRDGRAETTGRNSGT